jgi:hypothetical protein
VSTGSEREEEEEHEHEEEEEEEHDIEDDEDWDNEFQVNPSERSKFTLPPPSSVTFTNNNNNSAASSIPKSPAVFSRLLPTENIRTSLKHLEDEDEDWSKDFEDNNGPAAPHKALKITGIKADPNNKEVLDDDFDFGSGSDKGKHNSK